MNGYHRQIINLLPNGLRKQQEYGRQFQQQTEAEIAASHRELPGMTAMDTARRIEMKKETTRIRGKGFKK